MKNIIERLSKLVLICSLTFAAGCGNDGPVEPEKPEPASDKPANPNREPSLPDEGP